MTIAHTTVQNIGHIDEQIKAFSGKSRGEETTGRGFGPFVDSTFVRVIAEIHITFHCHKQTCVCSE